MNRINEPIEDNPIIAAIRNIEMLDIALDSNVNVIFLLCGNILNIEEQIKRIKVKGKLVCVHIEFVEGLGRDSAAIEYLKEAGADGIITTKPNLIKDIKSHEMIAIQRLFMLDSRSLETGIKSVLDEKPYAVEIMPGVASKVIKRMKRKINIPIIAGGLINDKEDIIDALSCGASAVSTSNPLLWNEWN